MKKKIYDYLKSTWILIGILLVCISCEEETYNMSPQKENVFKTVSIDEAKDVFNSFLKNKPISNSIFGKSSTDNEFIVDPSWNTVSQRLLDFTDALLTDLDVEINRSGNYSTKIFFISINGDVLNALETKFVTSSLDNGDIENGIVYYNDLQGKFIDAYKFVDGELKYRLVPKVQVQKASLFLFGSFFQDMEDIDIECWASVNGGELDEVTLDTSSSKIITVTPITWMIDAYSGGGDSQDSNNDAGGGGGSGSSSTGATTESACGDGYTEDANGACIPDITYEDWENFPCQKQVIENLISSSSPFINIIKSTFDVDKSVNIVFEAGFTGVGAATDPFVEVDPITGATTVNIAVTNGLLNSATDLGLAAAMTHELVHAHLIQLYHDGKLVATNSEFDTLYNAFLEFYKDSSEMTSDTLNNDLHNAMVDFISKMANSLYNYAKGNNIEGVSPDFATDLAWGTLHATTAFKTILTLDEQQIKNNTYGKEQNNASGAIGNTIAPCN